MNRSTVFALAETLVAVELFKQRWKIAHDAFEFHLRTVHQVETILAVPLKSVHRPLRPRHFDHNTQRARLQPLRRMTHVRGQQENLPFFDRNLDRWLPRRLHQAEKDVSPELIKEFLGGVVVVVSPVIRTSDNRDHQFSVFPYLRIPYRRLQLLPVVLDPSLKIECLQFLDRRHSASYFSGLYATARTSISKWGCGN